MSRSAKFRLRNGLFPNALDVFQVHVVPVVRSQKYVLGDYVGIHRRTHWQCPTGDGSRLVENLVSDFLPVY